MKTKKELILEAGIFLFWKFGPKKVSIDQIVKKAKIAKGTFYLYFSNKEELYQTIIDNIFIYWESKKDEFIKKYPDIKERILVKVMYSLKMFEQNNIIRNIIFWNENYSFWKITKEYIESHHLKLLKPLLWNDETIDYDLVSKISFFYVNILNVKSQFKNEDEFYYFAQKFAGILVNWLFTDYESLSKTIDYKNIKI